MIMVAAEADADKKTEREAKVGPRDGTVFSTCLFLKHNYLQNMTGWVDGGRVLTGDA